MKKLALILTLVTLLCFGCGSTATAFATTATNDTKIEYTNALEDLSKDENFDPTQYPMDPNNYSLELITIAESVNDELFVYVYSPGNTRASSINISLVTKDVSYINYTLTLINIVDQLHKYKVDGLTVNSQPTRYYEITSIMRPFDSHIDAQPDNGNTIDEVVFKVGKGFTFSDTPEGVITSVIDVDVITITDKYVGFMRYPDGGLFASASACDVHFVAFSTDKTIDKLLEADVYYTTQSFSSSKGGSTGDNVSYGEKEACYSYLDAKKDVTYTGTGWFSAKYQWNSIEKPDAFLESEDQGQMYQAGIFDVEVQSIVNEESIQKISSQDWVLRFAMTDYSYYVQDTTLFHRINKEYTIVGDVSILRLAFETNGKSYNLGVVDNKQSGTVDPDTGEPLPDNNTDTTVTIPEVDTLMDKIKNFGLVVLVAVVVIVAFKLLKGFFDLFR